VLAPILTPLYLGNGLSDTKSVMNIKLKKWLKINTPFTKQQKTLFNITNLHSNAVNLYTVMLASVNNILYKVDLSFLLYPG
jgi:hypothetical protein